MSPSVVRLWHWSRPFSGLVALSIVCQRFRGVIPHQAPMLGIGFVNIVYFIIFCTYVHICIASYSSLRIDKGSRLVIYMIGCIGKTISST